MNIVPFNAEHIGDAATLVSQAYAAERAAVPALPQHEGYRDMFIQMISGLIKNDGLPAFAAVEHGRLLGYLAGYPAEQFFSSHSGVYVPFYGSGTAGEDRRLVLQRLYAEASGVWVGEGRLMHAVSVMAHDHGAVDAWYWLGFGLRCVDAIRPLAAADAPGAGPLEVRKASPADAAALYPLHQAHCAYYRNPPLFMPNVELEGGLPEFAQWLSGQGQHLWAAYLDGKPVSYMRVRHGGETFVADDAETVNICGAYTAEAARGSGAGTLLLREIVRWAGENGYRRLGVDFESFNVQGSRFWMKHFTPFLFSVVRAIDDRVLSQ